MKIPIHDSESHAEDSHFIPFEPAALARRLLEANLAITESQLQSWEGELRKLNLSRAQNTTKILALQAESTALATQMDVLDAQSLTSLIGGRLGEGVTAQAARGAVELLVHPPSSNPPGSLALLGASTNLLLLLKSVQMQRCQAIVAAKKLFAALGTPNPSPNPSQDAPTRGDTLSALTLLRGALEEAIGAQVRSSPSPYL